MLDGDIAQAFFTRVLAQAAERQLLSAEHFTVDGTLLEAWAGLKSFRPMDDDPRDQPPPDGPGNPTVNFHGQRRSNATHQSTTDPEARLHRKGPGRELGIARRVAPPGLPRIRTYGFAVSGSSRQLPYGRANAR